MFAGIPYLRIFNPNNVKTRILSLGILMLLPLLTHGQSAEPRHYYAVIGVFRILNNAIRYTDKANKNNFSAQYEINPDRKLYYVYLLNTTGRQKAFAFMIKMRPRPSTRIAGYLSGSWEKKGLLRWKKSRWWKNR